jgi:formylglycine-generating enzyme required for sulfatase activity
LSAYQIGKYPLTVEEFGKYVDDGGPEPRNWDQQLAHPNRPVVDVSWHEAVAYCRWAGVRLPSEAEWERAARGVEGRGYPWGSEDPDPARANYHDTKLGAPTPVGLFPQGATPEGICDLAGNVWEWVADWYAGYPAGRQRNPTGPASGKERVLRGGSWDGDPRLVRASGRGWYGPEDRSYSIGFRCAREVSFP